MKENFEVEGMTCTACAAAIERTVSNLEGVDSAVVNFATEKLAVAFDPGEVSQNEIEDAVSHIGYKLIAETKNPSSLKESNADRAKAHLEEKKKQMITALIFAVPLFYLSMGPMMGLPIPTFLAGENHVLVNVLTQLLLCLPVLYSGMHFYTDGFKALWNRIPNMDSLIAVGTSAAGIYSTYMFYRMLQLANDGMTSHLMHMMHNIYFESVVVIIALISVGKYMEARAKGKTSEAIEKLIELAPDEATILIDGVPTVVPIDQVKVGDLIQIKPGEKIPVDGVITKGRSSVDESLLTGESIPVEKEEGRTVIAGSINKTGSFIFEASKVGADTTLSKIITLVEEAQSSKAPISKLADEISRYFVPIVMGIAILAMIIWLIAGKDFAFALSIGIAVLVISCPCALGLATPTAIMVGTGVGASNGILFKNGEALESLGKGDTIVFDKTGTLTEGKPKLTDLILTPGSNISKKALLKNVASLESQSEHPLSVAIVEKAQEDGLELLPVSHFSALPGMGIEGTVDGQDYLIGNQKLMASFGLDLSSVHQDYEKLSAEGKTPLFVAISSKLVGVIAVADVLKKTSPEAVAQLEAMGLEVYMLTGDNARTAGAIAKQAGIHHVIADVLPDQKANLVKKLQSEGKNVIMTGDGINDAPALAQANVGVAIGSGTDVAIESADVVLMRDDLMQVVTAVQLSKATYKNIKMGLFWAFFYNTICIPVAAGVLYPAFGITLNAMFAAAAMSLSSICVLLNALSLRTFKVKTYETKPFTGKVEVESAVHAMDVDEGSNIIEQNQFKNSEKETGKTQKEVEAMNEDLKIVLKVKDMSCQHCVARVEETLMAQPGVIAAKVDLDKGEAYVEAREDIFPQALSKAVTEAGYPAEVVSTDKNSMFSSADGNELKTVKFDVKGMSCQHCVNRVTKTILDQPGVVSAHVNLEQGTATADVQPTADAQSIAKAVTDQGYQTTVEK